jgi:hypothetical protein
MQNTIHIHDSDNLNQPSAISFCGLEVSPGKDSVPARLVTHPHLTLFRWCETCLTSDDYILWKLARV